MQCYPWAFDPRATLHNLGAKFFSVDLGTSQYLYNDAATVYATTVNGGNWRIRYSWCLEKHFEAIYNSVPENGLKEKFCERLQRLNSQYALDAPVFSTFVIHDALGKQKKGKAAGPIGSQWKLYSLVVTDCWYTLVFCSTCLLNTVMYPLILCNLL